VTRLADPVTIRVMVFNIEEGGAGVDFAKVVEAIRRADADIVAIQEAMGSTARVAEALDWAYASHRTQVVSRYPLILPAETDGVSAYVEVRPGYVVALASVHPPAEPYGPELALAGGSADEVMALERRIRLPRLDRPLALLPRLAEAGIPVFLLGDFNAPSHLDWTAATVGLRPHVRTPIEWPVSLAIEAAGFRDSWREIHPDPVADPGLTWWAERPPTGGYEPGPDTPDDRIDIIYAAGPSVTTDCRIVGEPGRPDVAISVDPWPSDHRAVVASFKVEPSPMPEPHDAVITTTASALIEPTGSVRLRTSKPTFRVGEPIDVRWAGGPGYRWDWIAVFRAPADDLRDAHLVWEHTDARVEGSVRLDAGSAVVDQSSVGGVWPLPPGDYEAAYLLDDGMQRLARVAFRVAA
jgi:exonuclease III